MTPRRLLLVAAVLLAGVVAFLALRRPTAAPGAVEAPGATPATDPQASRRAPRPPAGLPIHVPAAPPAAPDEQPASFEGRVVASDRGEGVAGAELTFSRAGAVASVRAAEDGGFRFEPPADGRWLLAAVAARGFLPFAPEWGHSPVQLDARAGRHVRGIEIHLTRAVALEGRVEDPEGRPVEGAEVRILGAAGEAALVPIEDRFVTDAAGAFAFSAPEGSELEARKAGHLPGRATVSTIAAVNGRLTITIGPVHRPLGEPRPISGRVVARGGGAVEGALVAASGDRRFGGGTVEAQTLSGPDGRFTLPPLDPGRYRVDARADGRAPAVARRVEAGARDVVLELDAGGRLRGCVTDASSGSPVVPFTVMVWERRGALRRVLQRSLSVVDPSGCYALDDLAPGPAAVVVSAPGRAPSPELAVSIPPPPAEEVANAALEAGGRLVGVVRDEPTGDPLPGARIGVEGALEAAASTFPVLSEAVADAAGRFVLDGLPRRFSIQVAAAGHHGRIVGGLEVGSGETRGPVDVALRPAAEGEAPRFDLVGVGIVLAAHGEGLGVAQVMAGSGAAEAGIRAGDVVLRVDGQPVAELGFAGSVDAIRGAEGTVVVLTVRRGDRTMDVPVPRRLVRG